MPIVRHFLGWERPCLHTTAKYLSRRFARDGELDMRGVSVILPTARAARRLEELLLEEAESRRARLAAPWVATIGQLAQMLFDPPRPAADDLTRQLVWAEALRSLSRDSLSVLFPHRPQEDDLVSWTGLGRWLDAVHSELSGQCLGFLDLVDAAEQLGGENEAQRWRAAAKVKEIYLRRLDALDLCDGQEARLAAIRDSACRSPGPMFLIASDLSVAQCRMLEQVADEVTALIFAPQSLAKRFDRFGNIVAAEWTQAELHIEEDRWVAVERPSDQAQQVLQEIAACDGAYAAEQISVGVADASIVPHLCLAMRARGLPVHDTAGTPAAQTGPCRFLAAAGDYLEGRRFADLATLLRHPDLERWVCARLGSTVETRQGVADWLTLMDRYYSDHLHGRLSGHWLGRPETRDAVERVYRAVSELIAPLSGAARSLREWAEPIGRVLVELYGPFGLDPEHESDRRTLRGCELIHGALQSLHELPEPIASRTEAAQALRLVLKQMAEERISAELDTPAIDLLGWLDLSLDDAPALIVTGFNEGFVPTSLTSDPLLPDSLRRRVGLRDNEQRYARDAYLLSAILASRPRVKLVAGRWSAEGDPLAPSRLLFACDEDRLPQRVRSFLGEQASSPASLPWTAADRSGFRAPPSPGKVETPIRRLNVTAFRDYLACPYRFYLKHILGLRRLDDAAQELDGSAFGQLAHTVLAAFGRSPLASSTDGRAIAAQLNQLLDRQVVRDFGIEPPTAVRVQIEQLRARFASFAQRQARHAAEGWVIQEVELSFHDNPAEIEVDGRTIAIDGRIDRIDFNQRTGEYLVLDYKTGEVAQTPEDAHRRGERWTDLQLPLYHLLVGTRGISAPRLGYILLPRDPGKIDIVEVAWGEELTQALEEARRVVRAIWAQEFTPAPRPPTHDEFAEICGVGHLAPALAEVEEA